MGAAVMTQSTGGPSPQLKARIAGFFYLLTFVTGLSALAIRGRGPMVDTIDHIASVCYIVVTLLFYALFKPVNKGLSLLAAFLSLVGCIVGTLNILHLTPFRISPLVFFGSYCILIGYLIFRSTFLPRILGVLMALGGLGWLTFVSAPLAKSLSPYVYFPGIFGEGALTLWLLVRGVDVPKWQERNAASGRGA